MNKTLQYLTGIAFLTMVSGSAHAQEQELINDVLPPIAVEVIAESEILPDVKMRNKTHPQKILFTQLKLSKTQPSIDAFAKVSPFVAKAKDMDRAAVEMVEHNRISNAFSLHNEKEEIAVQVALQTDEYSSLQNFIIFDELDEKTFFRFRMYDENVGIVPENIQNYSKLALSKERAERMFQSIGGAQRVIAEFILKPVYADRKEPFEMDGNDYWLMFARIAEFRLWSNDNPEKAKLLWYNRADWYSPEDKSNLGGLYVKE